MGNSWDNTLNFKPDKLHSNFFRMTLKILESFGYSLFNPYLNMILGMSVDGMHELKFKKTQDCGSYISSEGVYIGFWKNEDINMGISFDISHGISLCTDHELHEGHEKDVELAKDLYLIFVKLCENLRPIFGYSSDEWGLEFLWQKRNFPVAWEEFKESIIKSPPPNLLFWLNYYDLRYFNDHIKHRIKLIPCKK